MQVEGPFLVKMEITLSRGKCMINDPWDEYQCTKHLPRSKTRPARYLTSQIVLSEDRLEYDRPYFSSSFFFV